jgi:hypothetical protein
VRQLRAPLQAAPGGGAGGQGESTPAASPVVPQPQENVVCVISDGATLCAAASAVAVVGEAAGGKAASASAVSATASMAGCGTTFAAAAEDACRQAYYLASQLVRL